jgi:hypothetical protein
MTNEEIFKYADKKLKKQEAYVNSIVLGTSVLFIIGLGFIYIPLGLSDIAYTRYLAVIVCFLPYIVLLSKYSDKYYRIRR